MAIQVAPQQNLSPNVSGGLQVYDADTLARLNDALKSGADPTVAHAQAAQYQAAKGIPQNKGVTYTTGDLRDTLYKLIPAVIGTVGAVAGGLATAGFGGEVAGGAGGAALGEEIRQRLQGGADTLDARKVATQAFIGGAGSLVGTGIGAAGKALGVNEVLGNLFAKAGIGKAAGETIGQDGAKVIDAKILPNSLDDTVNTLRQRAALGTGEKPVLELPANSSQGTVVGPTTRSVVRDNLAGKTNLENTGFTIPGNSNVNYSSLEQPTGRLTNSVESSFTPEVNASRVEENTVAPTVTQNITQQPTGRLTALGNSLRARVLNPDVAASPYGSLGEQALIDAQKTEGLAGTAANQYAQLPGKMADISSQISTKLAGNTNTIPSTDVLDTVFSKIDENPSVLGDKGAVQDAKQIIQQKFDATIGDKPNATAQDVVNFKQSLGENASKLFSKSAKGQPLTQAEQAYLTAWQSVDGVVSDIAPEVKDLTLRQSNLYKMSGGLEANRGKGVINIPFLKNVGPTSQQAFTDKAGSLLQRIGGSGEVANQPFQSATARKGLAGVLGQVIGNGVTQGPTNGTSLPSQSTIPSAASAQDAVTNASTSATADQSQPMITDDQYNKLAAADVLQTGGKNLAKIAALKALTAPKATSSSDQTANANLSAGLAALDELQQASNSVNTDATKLSPGYLLHQGENKVTGIAGTDPNITTLENSGTQVIAALKALTGTGRLNQTEIANASAPEVGDTQVQAQTKLANLKKLLKIAQQARSTN